jgi:sulfite reductase (NADPH) hemoprotein beta-component
MSKQQPSEVEGIKTASRYLRGSLAESLVDPLTGALADDDTQLSKFHGIYQQDDRDLRAERRQRKLEPAYSFMIRVRVPGGLCTAGQWLALNDIASRYANGTLRLTTRQAVQYHGVLKRELKQSIASINQTLLDTLAACGDVNRNVMCTAHPEDSPLHAQVFEAAQQIHDHLTPATGAYHEIWLDGDRVVGMDAEPIYGATYLPRKFKTVVALPPVNDVDVFAHDLGFIAIVEGGELAGFNVTVGGGLGMTHGDQSTYPRLADVIGFCTPGQVRNVAEHVVTVQRDYGDRSNRRRARLKYTIDERGVDWFAGELNARLEVPLAPPRPFEFESTGDTCGWTRRGDGRWNYTLFVENGRVADTPARGALRTALREVAEQFSPGFRITPNQNLTITGIEERRKHALTTLLMHHGVISEAGPSPLRRSAMACVAFPTCSQAMAEAERYLPTLIDAIDALMVAHGLEQDAIVTRMTGCPNGCARPYLAEIGLVGKGPGTYNLLLGASPDGRRLNTQYRENIGEQEILAVLDELLGGYARHRERGEAFGDWVVRAGHVPALEVGREFHRKARMVAGE